ncbi:MAG: antibiotic biosynthesis monooxygenase [Bacilli bacterium]
MYIVCNYIFVEKGRATEVSNRFEKTRMVHNFDGFLRMEILVSEEKERDTVVVRTDWRDKAAFDVWVGSDEFKAAHKKREEDPERTNPVIGNELRIYTQAHEHIVG